VRTENYKCQWKWNNWKKGITDEYAHWYRIVPGMGMSPFNKYPIPSLHCTQYHTCHVSNILKYSWLKVCHTLYSTPYIYMYSWSPNSEVCHTDTLYSTPYTVYLHALMVSELRSMSYWYILLNTVHVPNNSGDFVALLTLSSVLIITLTI
jgi:hypothetical protein